MNILCPKCSELMVIMDRQGVHIDYCPKCHGIFLDRGEMEKLMTLADHHQSRMQQQAPASYAQPGYAPAPRQAPPIQPVQPVYIDSDYDYRYRSGRRRKGFLHEIFDFD